MEKNYAELCKCGALLTRRAGVIHRNQDQCRGDTLPSPTWKNLTLSGFTGNQGVFFLEPLNIQTQDCQGRT